MFFLFVFGIPLVSLYIDKKRRAKIPKMTIDELRQMAAKNPVLYSGDIVREMRSRGEDITFAFPIFLKMAIDKKFLSRSFGWAGLKTYFSKTLKDIDFSENRPSQTTLNKLRMIESKL